MKTCEEIMHLGLNQDANTAEEKDRQILLGRIYERTMRYEAATETLASKMRHAKQWIEQMEPRLADGKTELVGDEMANLARTLGGAVHQLAIAEAAARAAQFAL